MSAGATSKITLSTSGLSSFDPNPYFVLDSVQPAGAISGLPLVQNSPDFYFSVPVKAFFSHTDSLSGCSDTCIVSTSNVAVSDTALIANNKIAVVALLHNDLYFEGEGYCTSISTSLVGGSSVQHGQIQFSNDTVRYQPNHGWTGIDSLLYVLNVCEERDTAAVYFITVRDTFEGCPSVSITMSMPDFPGIDYTWYDSETGNSSVTNGNSYQVTKDSPDDIGEWWLEAVWYGYTFPRYSVSLIGGLTATGAQISHFTGDTLILSGETTTLTAHASSEVVNPVFTWYDAATNGTFLETESSYTTPPIITEATYYVSVSGDNYCTATERKGVTVHTILPPRPADDTCSTLMNTSLTYKVLANDTLPELCTEPEVIIVQVHHDVGGSAEVLPNGEIRYTPSAGFTGRVVIAYQVKCGSAISLEKKLSIIVSQPLSQTYTACENAIATIGFHSVNDITYNWYDDAHNLLTSGSDTLMVTKDNNTTQTYYAEPIYNALPHGCLFEVTLDLNPSCGTIPMSGCMTDGTVIWKEDFGGNASGDPVIASDPGWKAAGKTTYDYTTTPPVVKFDNEYGLLKNIVNPSDVPAWSHNPDDHTSENDRNTGYYLTFDATDQQGRYYEFEVDELCPNMPLTFSAWLMNMVTLSYQSTNSAYVDPTVAFVILDSNALVLSTFFTNTIAATNTPEWVNYSFPFVVPAGIEKLKIRIVNSQFGSASGNNISFDDLEVRICVPPATLVQPQNTDIALCEGDTLTLEATFEDDGMFGPNLVYQWEYSTTGNPTDWTVILGSEGVSSNSQINTVYPFASILLSDSGYYRFVVSTPGNVDNKNCCAVSDVIHVRVSPPVVSGTVSADTTICYDTQVATLHATAATGGSSVLTYQWQQSTDGGTSWENVTAGANANTLDYTPPVLTQTTMYRLRSVAGTLSCDTAYSLPITVTVYPQLLGGTIGSSQSYCYNVVPAISLGGNTASGGTGNYTYQWSNSPDGITWGDIPSAISSDYLLNDPVTETLFYRRTLTDLCGIVHSDTIRISVYPLTEISSELTNICVGIASPLSPSTGGTWKSDDETVIAIENNNAARGISKGKTTLVFTSTANGCTDTIEITVGEFPDAEEITGVKALCADSVIQLSNPTPNGVWSSNNGNVTFSNPSDNPVSVTGVSQGTTYVTYTISDGNCQTKRTHLLKVTSNIPPEIYIGIER
jgi:hypothetical protein